MKRIVCCPGSTVADFGVLPSGLPSNTTFEGGVEVKVSVAFLPAGAAAAGAGAGAGLGREPPPLPGDGPAATGAESELELEPELDERSMTNVFSAWPSSKSMRFSKRA